MVPKRESIERVLELLLDRGALFAGRAATVLVAFTFSWLLAGWAQRAILRAFGRASHVDATLVRFLASTVRYALLVIALVSCLSTFGITTTSFAAVLGAAGIAIGLAFQGTLSNFAAGLMLLIFRPFRVGDTIKAGIYTGNVKALELFSTVLVTTDNRRVVLPNSSLSTQPLENITYYPVRRVELRVPLPWRADAEAALSALVERARQVPNVHTEPPPEASIQDFRDRAVNVLLGAWCDTEHVGQVTAALGLIAKQVLDEARVRRRLTPKSHRGDAPTK
jgi:small conductance mechanosensitive channel